MREDIPARNGRMRPIYFSLCLNVEISSATLCKIHLHSNLSLVKIRIRSCNIPVTVGENLAEMVVFFIVQWN